MTSLRLLLFLLLLGWAAGCKPETFDSVGEPFNRVQQLQGTWKIAQAIQVDMEAEYRGYPDYVQRQDVTRAVAGANFGDFEITFTVDAAGKPATFSATKGSAPVDVPASGTWAFNDPEFPSIVTLTSGAVVRKLDIASLANLPSGRLTLKEVRQYLRPDGTAGKEFLRYEYAMTRK